MPEKKKEWVKPKLTVLVRPNSAEAVLGICKIMPSDGAPVLPAGIFGACHWFDVSCYECEGISS